MAGRQIGNYRIIDYIGSGGFGSVFKAEDITTPGRLVAIKELHRKHTRSSVIKQRFFQEALAMARLDHPNLPRLFTFGEDNGSYYLVMEFLSGSQLSEELHGGPIASQRAAFILAQVMDAVSYAHRNGVIHRDLKPDNIMLMDEAGSLRVKVLDFGIARMVGGENLTIAGEGFGTPPYMSPERIAGSIDIDQRTDIYSLGIILYEMLAGQVPFNSSASDPAIYWSEMRDCHTNHPVPSLSHKGVAAEFEKVIKRATAKRVEDRYSTADEMLADLTRLIDSSVSAALGPKPARLHLTTVPAAAEVYLDDVLRGATNAATGKIFIDSLSPGLHSVRVSKPGFNDYRISVSLEADRQTDLQVALAARATMVMPSAEQTAAMEADTARLDSGDQVATALLVVEGLAAGSAVFVGADAVAEAGEDGRATVKLDPGVHEVRATDPAGVGRTRRITVADHDVTSPQTQTISFSTAAANAIAGQSTGPNPLGSGPVNPTVIASSQPAPSALGKRVAVGVAVLLLLGLTVAAYFLVRGPEHGNAQVEQIAAQPAVTAAEADAAKQAAEAHKQAAQERKLAAEARTDEQKSQESAAAQKKLGEKKPEEKKPDPAPAQIIVPPPAPVASEQPPAQGNACVSVVVTGPDGQRLPGMKVAIIDQPNNTSSMMHHGQTGGDGQWLQCGLTAGSRIRVVAGRGNRPLASRMVVVAPGRTSVELQVRREAGAAIVREPDRPADREAPVRPGRKFPFRRRP
jgi:serine/threonine protein kinase